MDASVRGADGGRRERAEGACLLARPCAGVQDLQELAVYHWSVLVRALLHLLGHLCEDGADARKKVV